jgi:DNA mismatch repair protein MutS2
VAPNPNRKLHLLHARHPFLDAHFATARQRYYEREQEDRNQMVAFNLSLDDEIKGLIISGANTGGKTVTLKTTGLIAWMANSGLPVPVDEGSQVPYYSTILADIGDNQSLSHNLSTFASHLANMREVLAIEAPEALVLLDELGSGTDPREGNALALALIEEIGARGFHLLVTTHQQVLTTFALNHPHLENGSMAFDPHRLKPTYRFNQGVPGRSHALDIARDAGLPESVLARATDLLDEEVIDIQAAINELQQQHKQLHKQKQKLRREERRLQRRISDTKREEEKFQQLQDEFKERSRARIKRKVDKAEQELRGLIQEIGDRKTARESLSKMAKLRDELVEPEQAPEKRASIEEPLSGKPPEAWREGDRVYLKLWRRSGRLLNVDRKKARVDCDGKVFTVAVDEVLHMAEQEPVARPQRVSQHLETADGGAAKSELKLLGFRVEEALMEVDRAIDGALRSGVPFLRVIHGHGSGALKTAVREHLRIHGARSSFEVNIDPENDGVTELKF